MLFVCLFVCDKKFFCQRQAYGFQSTVRIGGVTLYDFHDDWRMMKTSFIIDIFSVFMESEFKMEQRKKNHVYHLRHVLQDSPPWKCYYSYLKCDIGNYYPFLLPIVPVHQRYLAEFLVRKYVIFRTPLF